MADYGGTSAPDTGDGQNGGDAKTVGTATEAIADINAYEREYQNWQKRGENIIKRYRDERAEATNLRVVSRKYNILWSNTETLKPTLYARLPRVQVERRFKDADPIGRTACEVAERAGNYLLETSPFDNVMRLCVQDRLLPGRAVAWVNYRAEMSQPEQPMGSDKKEGDEPESPLEKIQEMIEPIYVDWRDFGHSPRRTWQEVPRAWRVCHMTRKQCIDRFGKELGERIPLDEKHDDSKEGKVDNLRDTARVYEVWDKDRKKVCWVSKSQPDYLDESDPPVDVEGFFPFPRPLFATMTNDTLIPIPDYVLYQDQAAELDKITNRIGRFSDGLKLAGVCDATVPELTRLLAPNGSPDNMLIPVANFAGLKEKGGIAGAVQLLPVQEIAAALLSLYEAREQVLSVIYQVTGIADVIRGASNPNETATAQSIKGQFASLRIKDTQAEVARFSRDTARIIVEIAVEMYEPETLYEMVQADQFTKRTPREEQQAQLYQQMGLPAPKPREQFMEALRLLRDDKMRSFHIDIETDSTIALNEQEEKQNVTEFLTAFGGFLGTFGKIAMEAPAFAPVVGEALLYATRRFKAGRSLESSIEKAVAQFTQMASQPKPNPEAEKLKLEMQLKQQEGQRKERESQQKLAYQAQEHQQDLQFKQAEHQMDLQADAQQHQMDMIQAQEKGAIDMSLAQQKAAQQAQAVRDRQRFQVVK